MPDEAIQPPAARNERGHFAVGNQAAKGFGNPDAKLKSQYKAALMAAGSPEKVTELVESMFAAALGGDMSAAKILIEHWCGKPVQHADVTVNTTGSTQTQTTYFTEVMSIISSEEPDQERRLRIMRRMLRIGGQPVEGDEIGRSDESDPRG
jgi:hypothetical protein